MATTIEAELLRANVAFYEAFAERDIEAMDALWAREHPVACAHPGWAALHGRDEVMSSWRGILLGGQAPKIHCDDAQALAIGDLAGLVTCTEWIEGQPLVATNVFVREHGLWQLVHHQAGPVNQDVEVPPPGTLN